MSIYDFKCLLCDEQFDGDLWHKKPGFCPICNGPKSEIVDAEAAEEEEARNKAINKHDEYLEEDMRNDNA